MGVCGSDKTPVGVSAVWKRLVTIVGWKFNEVIELQLDTTEVVKMIRSVIKRVVSDLVVKEGGRICDSNTNNELVLLQSLVDVSLFVRLLGDEHNGEAKRLQERLRKMIDPIVLEDWGGEGEEIVGRMMSNWSLVLGNVFGKHSQAAAANTIETTSLGRMTPMQSSARFELLPLQEEEDEGNGNRFDGSPVHQGKMNSGGGGLWRVLGY